MSQPPKRESQLSTGASLAGGGSGSASSGAANARPAAARTSSTGPSTPVPSAQWASQKPADPRRSLYNQCTRLLRALGRVPHVQPYIDVCATTDPLEFPPEKDFPAINLGVAPRGYPLDPVSHLWRVLRLGAPLGLLVNALGVPESDQIKVDAPEMCFHRQVQKRMVYHFLQACWKNFGFKKDEMQITVSKLYSDSTSDLLKTIDVLNEVLPLLDQRGVLAKQGGLGGGPGGGPGSGLTGGPVPVPAKDTARAGAVPPGAPSGAAPSSDDLPPPISQRDKIVNELVTTERKYVQDLELLAEYHDGLLAGQMPQETVNKMLPYIPRILDFQRRFLVGLEYHARLPPAEQQFGPLFDLLKVDFRFYANYTLDQKEASDLALALVPELMPYSSILEPLHELQAMLIKPVQRICKYPLLLRELVKQTPQSWPHAAGQVAGMEVMAELTQKVNETQRKVENRYVFSDLRDRLKDWRGLNVASVGELLLSGAYPVMTMDTVESDYHLYLFEQVLLCCRDSIPQKKGGLKMRAARQSKRFSLDLKGRIYIAYVTAANVVKTDTGSYILSICWGRGTAAETGTFDIRLGNEEQASLWEQTLQRLIAQSSERRPSDLTTAYDNNDDDHMAKFYDDAPPLSPADSLAARKHSQSSFSTLSEAGSRSRSTSEANIWPAGRQSSSSSQVTMVSPPVLVHHHSESMIPTVGGPYNPARRQGSTSSGLEDGVSGLHLRSRPPSSSGHFAVPPQGPGYQGQPGQPGPGQPTANNAYGTNPAYMDGRFASNPALGRFGHLAQLQTSLGHSAPRAQSAHPSINSDPNRLLIRIHLQVESYLIQVDADSTFVAVHNRVERKLRMCGKQLAAPLRMRYRDEDNDFVTLSSDDDLAMAIDCMGEELNVWVV